MRYLQRLNPVGGVADFWEYIKRPQPYRWPIAAVSVAASFGILSLIIWEEVKLPPERPSVTYISTFQDGRSDAEIRASNIANQRRQDEITERRAAAAQKRRETFREIARMSGMDVEEIDREIAADEAAEKAAQDRRRRELLQNVDLGDSSIDDSGT